MATKTKRPRDTNQLAKNHAHAIDIHYYNFGRIHKTLRVTPAMEAKVSDHVWPMDQISSLAN